MYGQLLHDPRKGVPQAPPDEVSVSMLQVEKAKSLPQPEEALQHLEDSCHVRLDSSKNDSEVYGVATKCKAVPYLQNLDSSISKDCPSANSTKFSKERPINKDKKSNKKNTYQSAQSSLCGTRASTAINCADPVSRIDPTSQENIDGGGKSAQPGNPNAQGLRDPKTLKDIVENIPSEHERIIREECLINSASGEEFRTKLYLPTPRDGLEERPLYSQQKSPTCFESGKL